MGFWAWLKKLFGLDAPGRGRRETPSAQEVKVLAAFQRHYGVRFQNPELLKLALTHRSYLSVTGQGPRESNERLEFLGDSVLGLVTSEFLYREHPTEHEGHLTKIKSLLVSKAILSRRALAMGLGRFVLMSHSEVESGGRQRLSILADAFESVVGAIYLDQGFEPARGFISHWLLRDVSEIVADKRHTNYKSHLQEYVQSTYHTHPVYRIRGEIGPDHSKHFHVDVMVGKRKLGEGRGRNKKEAEQAAARDALESIESARGGHRRERRPEEAIVSAATAPSDADIVREAGSRGLRRGRRTRRGRRPEPGPAPQVPAAVVTEAIAALPPQAPQSAEPVLARPVLDGSIELPPAIEIPVAESIVELEPPPPARDESDLEEVGRPEGPLEERHVDPYGFETPEERRLEPLALEPARRVDPAVDLVHVDREDEEGADEAFSVDASATSDLARPQREAADTNPTDERDVAAPPPARFDPESARPDLADPEIEPRPVRPESAAPRYGRRPARRTR